MAPPLSIIKIVKYCDLWGGGAKIPQKIMVPSLSLSVISIVVSETVPKSINLEEIQTETKNDSLLPMIMSAIKNNSWRTLETQVLDCDKNPFKNIKLVKDELSINSDENVLLRSTRLVIPKALQ